VPERPFDFVRPLFFILSELVKITLAASESVLAARPSDFSLFDLFRRLFFDPFLFPEL
jgi:hypothetical protein